MYICTTQHEACQKIANVPVDRRKTNVMCELKTFNEIATTNALMFYCFNVECFSNCNDNEEVETVASMTSLISSF